MPHCCQPGFSISCVYLGRSSQPTCRSLLARSTGSKRLEDKPHHHWPSRSGARRNFRCDATRASRLHLHRDESESSFATKEHIDHGEILFECLVLFRGYCGDCFGQRSDLSGLCAFVVDSHLVAFGCGSAAMGNMRVRMICLRLLCALPFKRAKLPDASREGRKGREGSDGLKS